MVGRHGDDPFEYGDATVDLAGPFVGSPHGEGNLGDAPTFGYVPECFVVRGDLIGRVVHLAIGVAKIQPAGGDGVGHIGHAREFGTGAGIVVLAQSDGTEVVVIGGSLLTAGDQIGEDGVGQTQGVEIKIDEAEPSDLEPVERGQCDNLLRIRQGESERVLINICGDELAVEQDIVWIVDESCLVGQLSGIGATQDAVDITESGIGHGVVAAGIEFN